MPSGHPPHLGFDMHSPMLEAAGTVLSSTADEQAPAPLENPWLQQNNSPGIEISLDGNITHWNEAFITNFAKSKAGTLKDMPVTDLFCWPEKQWAEIRREILANREISFCTYRDALNEKKGPIEWRMVPRYSRKTEVIGLICIGRDVSESARLLLELEKASKLQRKMLPEKVNDYRFNLSYYYYPNFQLSGDSFGYHYDPKRQKLILYIIDIMGHGIYTSMQMASLHSLFEVSVQNDRVSAEGILKRMNQYYLNHFDLEDFAASMIVEVDFNEMKCHVISAGIPYILHDDRRTVRKRDFPGTPLGMFDQTMFRRKSFKISKRDQLILGTDGFFDALEYYEFPDSRNRDNWLRYLHRVSLSGRSKDDVTSIYLEIK
ncbi:SpoIIE family protein phosphatase [Salisediminibacterium selenitireducens]|uniref:PAS/PAC sensor protein n=1 Tax=Bacillus selenitireducens (strain ATCC 700615 / DSM 15326 / MLS10) TaxID=439292 RepID=D6Y147_BACIE|nr:SpoIIE family protein phosphatase [Salisediminibacterium selenitireducens]ADH98651.1 putative PAS/PAC sensor protein [[Bacillus] selenitireducens MLS10]